MNIGKPKEIVIAVPSQAPAAPRPAEVPAKEPVPASAHLTWC